MNRFSMPENHESFNDLIEPALDWGPMSQEIPHRNVDDKTHDEAIAHGKYTNCGRTLCGIRGRRGMSGTPVQEPLTGPDSRLTCQGSFDQLAREGTRHDLSMLGLKRFVLAIRERDERHWPICLDGPVFVQTAEGRFVGHCHEKRILVDDEMWSP